VSGAVFFVRLTYNSAVRLSFSRIDGWLLLMTFFWGSNFSIIKTAIREMPGPAFNGLRMVLASLVFLVILGWRDGLRASVAKVERRDWIPILVLSLVGHGLYQLLFLGGVARTSVANSSLIFGLTPVTVSLMSDRHKLAPWGLEGGGPAGKDCLVVVMAEGLGRGMRVR